MRQDLFEQKLESLGYFKKRYGDYNDYVFVPTPMTTLCVVCKRGTHLTIEKKWGYKDIPYWRVKCSHCKGAWENKVFTI